MRAYRGESPPVWAAYVYLAMAGALAVVCVVMLILTVRLGVCMESPVCRAEQEYRWEQNRIADRAVYERRRAELESGS